MNITIQTSNVNTWKFNTTTIQLPLIKDESVHVSLFSTNNKVLVFITMTFINFNYKHCDLNTHKQMINNNKFTISA